MPRLGREHATLVGEIYLGSENARLWNQALQTLARRVGADLGFLIDCRLDGTERTLVASSDRARTVLSGHLDGWQQVTQNGANGRSTRLVVSALMQGLPGDGDHYVAGGIFSISAERVASCCMKRKENNGPFLPDDLALIEAILPHLKRAMEMRAARRDGGRITNDIMDAVPAHGRGVAATCVEGDAPSPEQELVDRYHCTPTEAEVAVAMSGGARPDFIARARGVNVSTIRGHVKRIYAKLGVKRQADLMVRLRRVG